MAIIKTVNFNDMFESFNKMGRGEQFTYDALKALFEYYDALSDDIGENIELDVIAICCEWSEYELSEYNREHGTEFESWDDAQEALDDLDIRYIIVNDESVLVAN